VGRLENHVTVLCDEIMLNREMLEGGESPERPMCPLLVPVLFSLFLITDNLTLMVSSACSICPLGGPSYTRSASQLQLSHFETLNCPVGIGGNYIAFPRVWLKSFRNVGSKSSRDRKSYQGPVIAGVIVYTIIEVPWPGNGG